MIGRKKGNYQRLGEAFDLLPVLLPAMLSAFLVAAMLLLVLGQFKADYVWTFGPLFALVVGIVVYRYRTSFEVKGTAHGRRVSTILALVVAIGWVGINAEFNSSHLFTNRDPAVYTITADWLLDHQNLSIPKETELEKVKGIVSNSAGFSASTVDDSMLYAQGAHAIPVLVASAGFIVGDSAMFKMNVFLGGIALLAFFGFARLFLKPVWALTATVALGINLPFIYFSRDIYSETIALILVFSSLVMVAAAIKSHKSLLWILAGMITGASLLTRVDALLTIAGMLVFVFIYLALERRKIAQILHDGGMFLVGLAPPFIVGILDLSLLSSGYFRDLWKNILIELILLVLVLIAGVLLLVISRRTNWLQLLHSKTKHWLPKATFWVMIIVWVFFALRPLWWHPLEIDGSRSYSEGTMTWLLWYLGPLVMVAGFIGISFIVRRVLERKETLLLLAFFLCFMATTLVYVALPNVIHADQIWSARRFLPVAMPGLIFAAMFLFEYLYTQKIAVFKRFKLDQKIVIAVIATAAVVSPLVILAPFANSSFYAQKPGADQMCASLDKNDTVVWIGVGRLTAIMPTRTVCNLPAVGYFDESTTKTELTTKKLKEISAAIRQQGRTPVLAIYQKDLVAYEDNFGSSDFSVIAAVNFENIEIVMNKIPTKIQASSDVLVAAEIDSNGRLTPLSNR